MGQRTGIFIGYQSYPSSRLCLSKTLLDYMGLQWQTTQGMIKIERLYISDCQPLHLQLEGSVQNIHCVCRVICMKCGEITHRQKLQDQLLEMNPGAGEAIQRMVSASLC